ncbi:MAG: hypothetical protein V2G43_03825 [bacterium JZ-2024 1]
MKSFKSSLFFSPLFFLSAQLSGYWQTTSGWDDGKWTRGGLFWVERFRGSMATTPTPALSFSSTLELRTTYYRDLIPLHPLWTIRPFIDLENIFWDKEESRGEIRLDRAVLSYHRGNVSVQAGKMRFPLGVGWIFSATDMFQVLPPTAIFQREKRGIDGIVVEWDPSSGWRTSFAFLAVEEKRKAGVLRASFPLSRFSISGHFGSFRGKDLWAFETEGPVNENFWIHAEAQKWGNHTSYLVGIHRKLSEKWEGYCQYFRNGPGAKSVAFYPWISFLRGEIQGVGRNYFACIGRANLSPLWDFHILGIQNLNDHSIYFNPVWKYSFKENQNIEIGWQYFTGDKPEEFAYSFLIYIQHFWYF